MSGTLAEPDPPAASGVAGRLGGYELLEEIGRGGMGRVWRAHQAGLEREVALKTLSCGANTGTARERFRREALAVARLNHPGIVTVHEVGEADGQPYLVMELVRGGTLAHRLEGGPLPARDAAALARGLADAVQHAHEAGVIHRDLKPSNVLLDERRGGAPRLTDFGLARLVNDEAWAKVTVEGIGSLAYLAPEQVAGGPHPVGPATDVHGLGAVLYHAASGRPPFQGPTPAAVLREVLEREPPPLGATRLAVPRDLDAICQRCLRKDPSARYPSAAALRDDLDRFLSGRPVTARPATCVGRAWRWCRRRPVWAAGLAGLIGLSVLAFGIWREGRRNSFEATVRREFASILTHWPVKAPGVAAEVFLREAPGSSLAFSPCGRWFAAGATDGRIAMRRLDGGPAGGAMGQGASIRALAWAAEGRWLVSGDIEGHWRVWSPTARPRRAASGGRGVRIDSVAFRPDGARFFVGYADGTGELWGWDGTNASALATMPHPSAPWGAEFGSDNRWLLTIGDQGAITVWDADNGRLVRSLATGGKPFADLSADGSVVAFVRTNQAGREHVGFTRVADGTAFVPDLRVMGVLAGLQLSPDGGRLLANCGSEVRVYPLEGGRAYRTAVRPAAPARNARFSPDGLRFLTVNADDQVRIWDAHTGALLAGPFPNARVSWLTDFSPDGLLVATAEAEPKIRFWDVRPALPVGWSREAELGRALEAIGGPAALRIAVWLEPWNTNALRNLAAVTRLAGTPTARREADFLERRADQPPLRRPPERVAIPRRSPATPRVPDAP